MMNDDVALASMTSIEEEMINEELNAHRRNHEILSKVRAMVSTPDFCSIENELLESGHVYNFELVSSPKGQPQDEVFVHGTRYVNQTSNGGYSGDDFAGEIYIPVSPNQWFKFSYCM